MTNKTIFAHFFAAQIRLRDEKRKKKKEKKQPKNCALREEKRNEPFGIPLALFYCPVGVLPGARARAKSWMAVGSEGVIP